MLINVKTHVRISRDIELWTSLCKHLSIQNQFEWNPYILRQDLNVIKKVQIIVTKIPKALKYIHYHIMLDFIGLTTPEKRQTSDDLIEMYKII